ncbi:MAG: ATP-binding protein [Verrucomicrobia bacterium]|nr:ATP-binding protein [Verrucomicrobiota bacterium]
MIGNEFLSELFRIVEGALRQDGVKVRNYAALLADKLANSGDEASAQRLRKLIDDRAVQLHPARLGQTAPPPVDGESRFPLLERVEIPALVERHLLTEAQRVFVEDFLSLVKSRAELERKGVSAGTNLLFYGPPGCGKSHLAAYIARRLSLPMYVARLDGLISSFLGSTAKNIRSVFEFASRMPCVLLLDEFDAIAKLRDDQQELGELKRVVNSFIQNIDSLGRDIILIAATNHEQLLDPAVWRRFQYLLHIDLPNLEQREAFWKLFSDGLNWSPKELKALADLSEGFSVAAIEGAATRVRQQVVTRQAQPNLHGALTALVSLARGESSAKTALSSMRLDEPQMLAKQLRKRNPRIYSLSVVGEIVGVSKATMSRHAAVGHAKRKEC